jgi:hypothetical protein
LKTKNYKHIIELLLDELILIFDFYKDNEIIDNLKKLDLTIMNIQPNLKLLK